MKVSTIILHDFMDLTDKIPGEVEQIGAGQFHSFFITKDKKLYGCGLNEHGELGFKSSTKGHCSEKVIEIKLQDSSEKLRVEISSVHSGNLHAVGLCKTFETKS